jgi:hypothetical protein
VKLLLVRTEERVVTSNLELAILRVVRCLMPFPLEVESILSFVLREHIPLSRRKYTHRARKREVPRLQTQEGIQQTP